MNKAKKDESPNIAIAPGGDGSAALWALRIILHDLPQHRDWLDPEVEKFARELVAKHPGILPHDSIPAAGNAGTVDDAAIKRAVEAWYAHDPEGPDSDRAMRRAIAALAPAAQQDGHMELAVAIAAAKTADPPAADGLIVDVIEAAKRVIDCPPLRVMDLLESISSLRHALAAAEAGSAALNSACATVEGRADRAMRALKQCRPFVAYAFDQGIVGAEDAGRVLDAAIAAGGEET